MPGIDHMVEIDQVVEMSIGRWQFILNSSCPFPGTQETSRQHYEQWTAREMFRGFVALMIMIAFRSYSR